MEQPPAKRQNTGYNPPCAEFDFKSGDVLIFDGSPAADVAHGVLDTLAGTGPAELPDWAKGCAVSLQYRQRRK